MKTCCSLPNNNSKVAMLVVISSIITSCAVIALATNSFIGDLIWGTHGEIPTPSLFVGMALGAATTLLTILVCLPLALPIKKHPAEVLCMIWMLPQIIGAPISTATALSIALFSCYLNKWGLLSVLICPISALITGTLTWLLLLIIILIACAIAYRINPKYF
jgi:hypothetical protein